MTWKPTNQGGAIIATRLIVILIDNCPQNKIKFVNLYKHTKLNKQIDEKERKALFCYCKN